MYILDGNEYEEFADTTENPSVLISAFLIPGNICNDALNATVFVGLKLLIRSDSGISNLYVSCNKSVLPRQSSMLNGFAETNRS